MAGYSATASLLSGDSVGVGEDVAGEEGVGVVVAVDAALVGEELVELGDGVGDVTSLEVGEGEVVAGGERGGVVLALDALPIS